MAAHRMVEQSRRIGAILLNAYPQSK